MLIQKKYQNKPTSLTVELISQQNDKTLKGSTPKKVDQVRRASEAHIAVMSDKTNRRI